MGGAVTRDGEGTVNEYEEGGPHPASRGPLQRCSRGFDCGHSLTALSSSKNRVDVACFQKRVHVSSYSYDCTVFKLSRPNCLLSAAITRV